MQVFAIFAGRIMKPVNSWKLLPGKAKQGRAVAGKGRNKRPKPAEDSLKKLHTQNLYNFYEPLKP